MQGDKTPLERLSRPMPKRPWIISQIGSREHYAIPSLLAQAGQLEFLLTDYWSKPQYLWEYIPDPRFRKLRQRHHPDILNKSVKAHSVGRMLYDLRAKSRGLGTWESTIHRNEWYQKCQLKQLRRLDKQGFFKQRQGIFFSYSYAALELFKFFRQRGWINLLCQIDPGRHEQDLVKAEIDKYPQFGKSWEAPPEQYWQDWKQETELADHILVNSPWSQKALEIQGIAAEKISILPLAYAASKAQHSPKDYPEAFDAQTPLKILFLGQINVRKGVHLILQALANSPELPVQIDFVGPVEMDLPPISDTRIRFHGPVSRGETETFYQEAHLFILPTLSDGFAITQLEAQRWRLPIVASHNCGAVVRDKDNGLLLSDTSSTAFLAALQNCLEHPDQLKHWSKNSAVDSPFSLDALRVNLNKLENQLVFKQTL